MFYILLFLQPGFITAVLMLSLFGCIANPSIIFLFLTFLMVVPLYVAAGFSLSMLLSATIVVRQHQPLFADYLHRSLHRKLSSLVEEASDETVLDLSKLEALFCHRLAELVPQRTEALVSGWMAHKIYDYLVDRALASLSLSIFADFRAWAAEKGDGTATLKQACFFAGEKSVDTVLEITSAWIESTQKRIVLLTVAAYLVPLLVFLILALLATQFDLSFSTCAADFLTKGIVTYTFDALISMLVN